MKKLALALACLVSVAFFASCNPEGNPSIFVLDEIGFVQNDDIVDINTEFNYGFVMSSSIESGKELSSLIIKVDNNTPDTIALSGKSYTYKGVLKYEIAKDEIIATSTITAIVTDVAGKTATTSIKLNINQPATPLLTQSYQWVRRGTNVLNAEEMAQYGLKWEGTYKAPFATIKPIEGATMYLCDGLGYDEITTNEEKAVFVALVAETHTASESYRNIDANQSANYNDMLVVINNGESHLILVERAEVETITGVGTQITIKGELK